MGPLTFAMVRILADKTRARNVTERAELARRIGVMRELFPDVWELLQAPIDAGALAVIQTEVGVDSVAVYSVKLDGGRIALCIDGSIIDRETGLMIARNVNEAGHEHLAQVSIAMATLDGSPDRDERATAMLKILSVGGAVPLAFDMAKA